MTNETTAESTRTNGTAVSGDDNPFDNPKALEENRRRAAAQTTTEERLRKWGSHRYDLILLDGRRERWARHLRNDIARKNAGRDPVTDCPVLFFPGDQAVKAGASDTDMAALAALAPSDIAGLRRRAAAIREDERTQVKTMSRRIGAERDGTVAPRLVDSVLSISDLAELKPPAELIGGLLFDQTLNQLSGPPGSFKSFTTVGMSCALATGKAFGNRYRVPEPHPVVYVAAEGSGGIYVRIAAWCHQNGVEPAALQDMLHVVPHPVQMGDREEMDELAALVTMTRARLVVMDTRAKCTLGLEENSATEQSAAIAIAERLIAATGASILTVHHTALGTQRARGSSAWEGAVHSSLVQTVNDDGHAVIRCSKHKDAPDGCTHMFAMQKVTPPGGIESLAVSPIDPLTVAMDDARDNVAAIVELIVEFGGELGLSRAEIVTMGAEKINGTARIAGRSAMYKAITEAQGTGLLTPSGDKRAPKFTVTRTSAAL